MVEVRKTPDWSHWCPQGKAAAVQLNMYLEENAILHLERGAGRDQDRFQVN